MVEEKSMVTTQPPPPQPRYQDQSKVGGGAPAYVGKVSSSMEGIAVAGQSQTRATVQTEGSRSNDCVQNITAVKKAMGDVTVNGVNLMKLQRLRQNSDSQTTVKKKDTPQGKRKNLDTVVPSSGNIKNYFTKKTTNISGTVSERSDLDKDIRKTTPQTHSGEEDMRRKTVVRQVDNVVRKDECVVEVRKTTFSNLDVKKKKSVKENIKMFEDLLDDNDCVIGGGWCGTHHVRLVRSVASKRVSSIDENGGTTWLRGEAVISACPYKTDKQSNGSTDATELVPSEFEGTNGNKRFCGENELNQSTGSRIEREQP